MFHEPVVGGARLTDIRFCTPSTMAMQPSCRLRSGQLSLSPFIPRTNSTSWLTFSLSDRRPQVWASRFLHCRKSRRFPRRSRFSASYLSLSRSCRHSMLTSRNVPQSQYFGNEVPRLTPLLASPNSFSLLRSGSTTLRWLPC